MTNKIMKMVNNNYKKKHTTQKHPVTCIFAKSVVHEIHSAWSVLLFVNNWA